MTDPLVLKTQSVTLRKIHIIFERFSNKVNSIIYRNIIFWNKVYRKFEMDAFFGTIMQLINTKYDYIGLTEILNSCFDI